MIWHTVDLCFPDTSCIVTSVALSAMRTLSNVLSSFSCSLMKEAQLLTSRCIVLNVVKATKTQSTLERYVSPHQGSTVHIKEVCMYPHTSIVHIREMHAPTPT